MDAISNLTQRIEAIVARRAPQAWRERQSGEPVALGPGSLNLDSITIVEILLDCESALGVTFPPTLMDGRPLTIARLAEHASHAGASSGL